MQQQQKAAALAHSVVRAALVVLYDRHMTPSVRYGVQTPAEARGCARKARPRSASLIGRDANRGEGGGWRRDVQSVNQERESGGGRGLAAWNNMWTWRGTMYAKEAGSSSEFSTINNEHKKWVSQARARLSCCYFLLCVEITVQ